MCTHSLPGLTMISPKVFRQRTLRMDHSRLHNESKRNFYLENRIHLGKDTAIHGQVSFEQYQRDFNVRSWYDKEIKGLSSVDSPTQTNGSQATAGYGLYKA